MSSPGEVGPFVAVVTLQFRKEALAWIEVMDVSPEFGTSWDDWGEAKERGRRAAHDRWLEAFGAPAGRHPWARVWSDYDSKGGFSFIAIRYDQAAHAIKDGTARLLLILPWLSAPACLTAHLLLWDRIPERLAVHFDWSGAPNGWMSRGESLAFDIGALLFVLTTLTVKLASGERRKSAARLALLNVTALAMTIIFLGLLKYNISGRLF